jgi:hypothetical protein
MLAGLLGCASSLAQAAGNDTPSDFVLRNNASLRFGVETLTLPGDEKMGMMQTTYSIEAAHGLYLGVSAYGAVTGERGGFYTVGGEIAWRHKLAGRLDLETGMYVGGGGGGSSLVGGGLMLRPHANLLWDFDSFRAGISASKVRFPNGHINSNQIGLTVEFDTQFAHTGFAHAGEILPVSERTGVGFDRAMMVVGAYNPRKGSTFIGGAPLQSRIGFVGTRMERFITPNFYAGLEAAGAGSGGVAGYAEFLGIAGAEYPVLNDRFALGSRVALGMGGGGAVSVGGGLFVKAGAYATANISRDFHISLEGGIADSPNGNFKATYESLNLHWDLDNPHSTATWSRMVPNEWVGGVEHYYKAQRKDGRKQDVNLVTLKLNRYLTDTFYLTGQAHSAYSGQAGGYSSGLIGFGYRTPRNESGLFAGAEMLAGAGAGGGIDSSGGFLMQPTAYVGMGISKSVSARVSVGRIKSFKGSLSSNVAEFGLSYAFGTTARD